MHPALILTALIGLSTMLGAIALNTSNTVTTSPSFDGIVAVLGAFSF